MKSVTASASVSRLALMLLLTSAVALTLGFAPKALAADGGDANGWIGVQGGLSVPNYNNTTARPIYGITAGAKVGSEFGIGAYYSTSRKDETVNGITLPFGYDLYGVMAGYFFEGEAKGVYLGAMLGMTKLSSQVAVLGTKYDVSTSPTHYGLVAGYNKMLSSYISLGGELSYISIPSSSGSANGVAANFDAFSMLNATASLKFWF